MSVIEVREQSSLKILEYGQLTVVGVSTKGVTRLLDTRGLYHIIVSDLADTLMTTFHQYVSKDPWRLQGSCRPEPSHLEL